MARYRGNLTCSLLLLFSLLAAAKAQAPQIDITQAPPPIVFKSWQEVEETDDGTEYLETFPSPVVSSYPQNNIVPLRVFIPVTKKPANVVLIFHYWGATDLKLERTLATELNRKGIAAAVMTLPYHLTRTPAGYRSGELAIDPDPDRLKATMSQSVQDARRALDFLATRSEIRMDKVGVSGTSLGAIVTALVAATDERVTQASFLLGGVDIAHVLWTSSRVVPQRDMMRRRGITEEKLRKQLADVEPGTLLKKHHPASSFVVGGQFDTVVPRQSTEELIDVLQTKNVLWIDTGHYGGMFVQRRLMREVATYYNSEFNGNAFVTPNKLYAPTIRLGASVDAPGGLDIGIGLDLLKFDRRGDAFAALFITPRGPKVFAGASLAQGFAIGVFGSAKGLSAGLMWSVVL